MPKRSACKVAIDHTVTKDVAFTFKIGTKIFVRKYCFSSIWIVCVDQIHFYQLKNFPLNSHIFWQESITAFSDTRPMSIPPEDWMTNLPVFPVSPMPIVDPIDKPGCSVTQLMNQCVSQTLCKRKRIAWNWTPNRKKGIPANLVKPEIRVTNRGRRT